MNQFDRHKKRIGEILPETAIDAVNLNSDGLLNDIVVVNDEFVFRFPKHEYAFKHLKTEAKLLEFLQNKISLEIPKPFYVADDVLAYQLIKGEALRRNILLRFPETEQQELADQLAQFFKELHNVDCQKADFKISPADALMKFDRWLGAYERIKEKVFPLLMPHVRDSVREHFDSFLSEENNFMFEPKLVDTDLPPYHIIFDSHARQINGIIDFGCAGVGDPAVDFAVIIYNYGERFFKRFLKVYAEAEEYTRRARFYAGAQEVRWILTGLEQNNNWWFAVHVSGAKDFGYN